MMKIEEILKGIEIVSLTGEQESADITELNLIHGNVTDGSLFVAVKGYKTDGHDYITCSCRIRCYCSNL